jgi:hypothetical protein
MNATARQTRLARAEDNRAFVRELLAECQPAYWALLDSVVYSVNRMRTAGYPPALRDHAFGRTLCRMLPGEPLLAARARGYAAETAGDAFEAIRDGDMADARALLHSALTYLDTRDIRMEAAR